MCVNPHAGARERKQVKGNNPSVADESKAALSADVLSRTHHDNESRGGEKNGSNPSSNESNLGFSCGAQGLGHERMSDHEVPAT